jgi:hypothetical protein
MIISDDNVFPLYGDTLIRTLDSDYECHHLVLPHGEATKDFQTLPTVYKAMLEAKISRSDLVIALGGGVIGDLAGFAASSYLRGVRLVQIPTSLLAQVDSSVGGKVAVDLPEGKNLVGAFYRFWVLKESFMKATRRGMGLDMRTYEFAWRPDGIPYMRKQPDEYPGIYLCREYELKQGDARAAVITTDDEIGGRLQEVRLA